DIVTDDEAAQLFEYQYQAEREQHLLQMLAPIKAAEQHPFERCAEYYAQHDTEHDRGEQISRETRERERHVGADHIEAAVRQIDNAHDAENQRESAGNEKEQQAVLNAVEDLDQERGEIHGIFLGR